MIACRIQHHPSRTELLPPLIEGLTPLLVEVSSHASDPPSPWAGYKQALSSLPDCSHVLVLQDDVTVCHNFPLAVKQIAEANPETPVVLFLANLPKRVATYALRALARGEHYARTGLRINEFMPVVAVLWPTHKAGEFLEWAETAKLPGYPREPRSDDACAGRWAALTKQPIAFTIPSLVQHLDETPSLIGRRAKWGKDKGRVALHYIGENDPLEIDWS